MDSPPPDLLNWAFWFKDSAGVRDLLISLVALIGIPFLIWRDFSTHRTAKAATRQAEIAAERHQKQTEADRERRITDGFTKAIELLGKPELEVRIGAIYALERIAHESKRDHWPIMETLTAYVRTKNQARRYEASHDDYENSPSDTDEHEQEFCRSNDSDDSEIEEIKKKSNAVFDIRLRYGHKSYIVCVVQEKHIS